MHIPASLNVVLEDGRRAFDMNDIILRHPTEHHLWKVIGRFGGNASAPVLILRR